MAKDLRFHVALHVVKASANVTNEKMEEVIEEGFTSRGIECERVEVLGREEFDAGTLDTAAP